MRMVTHAVVITVFYLLAAGCSGQDVREGIYQGSYGWNRLENRGKMTSVERATSTDPQYHQYFRERKERIEQDLSQ